MFNRICVVLVLLLVNAMQLTASGGKDKTKDEAVVNIYSHRHYDVDRVMFGKFEESTGIKVNVVQAKADELIERMSSEGEASPADLLFTVDAGRLIRAKNEGLLASVSSEKLMEYIPAHLRGPEGYWYGLTKRARVIVWDKERMPEPELKSYMDLADPGLGKKVLIRSSSNIYNITLLSFLALAYGEEQAKMWASGVVNNMARDPQGNDRDQMKALVEGIGDYAVVNTYYVGLLLNSSDPEEVRVGERIGILFPDQESYGTHVNISGAGVAANAPNRENAIKLLEYMASPEVQEFLAQENFEYPVNEQVANAPIVESWGSFMEATENLGEVAAKADEAVRIFDEAGWR